MLCDSTAAKCGKPVEHIIECVQLAARIDHLIAIGGESAREHLLFKNCIISADDIANLCRRMPPFIAVKLKDLETGSFNGDSNPTGAFDTNGWGANTSAQVPLNASALRTTGFGERLARC